MNKNTKLVIREWIESLLIAFILAMLIRAFIVQAFKIPTSSMEPTLRVGDRILVSKFIYHFTKPQPWDVIVFKYPLDPKRDFIKRLVATQEETVSIDNGKVFIDGRIVDNPHISEYYYNRGNYGAAGQKITVPEDKLYVLGDNSFNSQDSRYWGFVPEENLIGKAFVVYWPLNRMGIIR